MLRGELNVQGRLAGLGQAGIVGPQASRPQQARLVCQDGEHLPVLARDLFVDVPFFQGLGPLTRQAELVPHLTGAENQG